MEERPLHVRKKVCHAPIEGWGFLTAARGHGGDLERVRVGGADGLLLVLGGHLYCLADVRQVLAVEQMVVCWTVNFFREREINTINNIQSETHQ